MWIEDDCRLKAAFSYDDLRNAALEDPAKLFWAGYNVKHKDGTPQWGTQLICATRQALRNLTKLLEGMALQQKGYLGFDTCC